MFRKLKASEIEARVATIKENGCTLLLYKDARVDQNILDETVGCLNWKRSHQLIGDRLYCTVEIWDAEKGQWISKQDVGTESYNEKEKGQASDSFKRACFNLGIGRELYTAPFIWIPAGKINLENKNGKLTTYDRFSVDTIGYDEEGNINQLSIRNEKKGNMIVFQMGEKVTEEQKDQAEFDKKAEEKISEVQLKAVRSVIASNPGKMTEEELCKKYKIEKIEDMTISNLNSFTEMLTKKKGK
jgi:hypothetical protein